MPSSKRQNAALVGAMTVNDSPENDNSSTKLAAVKAATKVVYPASSAVLGISSKTSVGAVVGETGALVSFFALFDGELLGLVLGVELGKLLGLELVEVDGAADGAADFVVGRFVFALFDGELLGLELVEVDGPVLG